MSEIIRTSINYSEIITKLEQKKTQFINLKTYLLNLDGGLPGVKTKLKEAEKHFANGAFISNNETFDKGLIKECCETIDGISESIYDVIRKVDNKITELENKITYYRSEYNKEISLSYTDNLNEQGD